MFEHDLEVSRTDAPATMTTNGGRETELHSPPPPPQSRKRHKPLAFHLAFLSLALMALIVSLDSTCLAIATPVRPPAPLSLPPLRDLHRYDGVAAWHELQLKAVVAFAL